MAEECLSSGSKNTSELKTFDYSKMSGTATKKTQDLKTFDFSKGKQEVWNTSHFSLNSTSERGIEEEDFSTFWKKYDTESKSYFTEISQTFFTIFINSYPTNVIKLNLKR